MLPRNTSMGQKINQSRCSTSEIGRALLPIFCALLAGNLLLALVGAEWPNTGGRGLHCECFNEIGWAY